jgi:Low affinity iron permease
MAFAAAVAVVVGWAVLGPVFGFSDTWQLAREARAGLRGGAAATGIPPAPPGPGPARD